MKILTRGWVVFAQEFSRSAGRGAYMPSGTDDEEGRPEGTGFALSLMHWRFPESPLPPSVRATPPTPNHLLLLISTRPVVE